MVNLIMSDFIVLLHLDSSNFNSQYNIEVLEMQYFVKLTVLIFVFIELVLAYRLQQWATLERIPPPFFKPCEHNDNVTVIFEPKLAPEKKNQYLLQVYENFGRNFKVYLKFDSDATVTLSDNSSARIKTYPGSRKFKLKYFKRSKNLQLKVQGPPFGGVPYVQSIDINTVEYCEKPKTGFLDSYIKGPELIKITITVPDDSCGRRKVQHTELIVNSLPTKPGDWPWHAAIYRLKRSRIDYICGGTLLSKIFILTAAHCVTSRGTAVLPETRFVILGKYNLVGGDIIPPQERGVNQIIVHEGFKYDCLDNDIALIKLKSKVLYSDFVQPACVWYSDAYKKQPPRTRRLGTVNGWGFNQNDQLSATLQQVTIPRHSKTTCIKSNPLFFSRLLNNQKFCAGFNNGTSACNGDSGGGFLVFVPDVARNSEPNATGAWYIRGIVSLSFSRTDAAICDPYKYVIFTDVAKFDEWINTHMG